MNYSAQTLVDFIEGSSAKGGPDGCRCRRPLIGKGMHTQESAVTQFALFGAAWLIKRLAILGASNSVLVLAVTNWLFALEICIAILLAAGLFASVTGSIGAFQAWDRAGPAGDTERQASTGSEPK